MASELLANWLNNEIELSKKVENFEKDFANGFLFGELLYKFNQQSNFKQFSKKQGQKITDGRDTVAKKLENFQMLEPTFRNLKIKFDSKMVDQIMKEERGLALRILYQLKMALEKVYPPTDIAVLRKTGKMGDNQPALKIAHSKEKYDTHAHLFFKGRLQELNKPQKSINMEKHLRKFEEEKEKQQENANKYNKDEQDAKDKVKQEIRRAQINKLQRNAGFMEEWLQKGVEDWKKNQTIKKEREKKDLDFEYKQAQQYNNLTTKKIDEATKEVHEGIDNFERTLRNTYGIETKVKKEEADKAVQENLTNSPLKKQARMSQSQAFRPPQPNAQLGNQGLLTQTGGMTLTSTGLKTKDKKTVTEKTRKERERRRRKMIVDQGKTHLEMEQQRREQQIIERMKRQAKQEEELQYEQWRTQQCKNVISENRKLREARYDKRRELDQQTGIWREEEMINQQREQMGRELETFKERDYEMRVVNKQQQREKRVKVGEDLFNAIFDIANEAYLHQQQADSEELDARNWKEWLQLFIEEQPIPNTLSKLANSQNIEDQKLKEAGEKLDQMELEDYLKNNGQWQTKLIKEIPVNLEQIIAGGGAEAAAAKGGKAPAKAPAADQTQLEEGDLELPVECPSNFLYGDVIEMIVNINFEARMKHKRPRVPHFLSLKLCLVGYAFAGKKTQAQRLKNEYGLEVFYLNELVHEAIEFFENHPKMIEEVRAPEQLEDSQQVQQEDIQKPENEGKGQESQQISDGQEKDDRADEISEDSELVQDLNPDEDFRRCGEQIKDLLLEGQEISDSLYVELIVAKLRMTFPHKDKKTLRGELKEKVQRELEIGKQLREIERELAGEFNPNMKKSQKKKRTPEVLYYEKAELEKELEKITKMEKNGWVLVDFPSTFAQAKLLEAALTGYVPLQECDENDREKQINDAYLLVQPNAKEQPPILLMKSGVDSLLWLDSKREECMRRALGRRYDSINEMVYHLEDQPPLTTSAPLCERLRPMDEDDNIEATLIDRWMAFDSECPGIQKWAKQFGIDSIKLPLLNKIDATLQESQVFEQIQQVIDTFFKVKQMEEEQIRNRIKESFLRNEQEEEARRNAQAQAEEEAQKAEETPALDTQSKEQATKVTKPEPATEKIGSKQPDLSNVDDDLKPVVLKMWNELSTNYKAQMKKTFSQVRGQRERVTEQFSIMQKKFLTFLHRPDTKQEKLEAFIKEFNEFSDQYPDLREDDATKEELHQRVDILSDELWEIIEERKEQEIEERKKIMESGWIENELGFVVQSAQQLMQTEVDKFRSSVQLIQDFYHAFEDKLMQELPPAATVDLVQEGEELPPVEQIAEGSDPLVQESYTYPRLDVVFSRALKAQAIPEGGAGQAADKKGAPPKGKDPKKVAEEEKPSEETQQTKDMKNAIKTEKQILRFRLTLIRNWALSKLKELRSKSLSVYSKLEDWINVAVKTENEAVDEMSAILKQSIEEEKKVQQELRIKFMDFCVDEKIMNFIVPPPEKLPALESLQNDRFSIPQLKSIVNELEQLGAQQDNQPYIPNHALVDMFLRRLENSKGFGGENGLPESWKEFKEQKFQTIVRNLDKYGQGHVNWKILATFLCLLKTPILIEKDMEAYNHELMVHSHNSPFIELDGFVKSKAFFDDFEGNQDRDYSHPFHRVQFLKELLFRANVETKENQHGKVNIKKFLATLKAKELTMQKRTYKTYADILLSAIDK